MKREEVVRVRMTSKEKHAATKSAAAMGMTVPGYLRYILALVEFEKKVLKAQGRLGWKIEPPLTQGCYDEFDKVNASLQAAK